MMILFSNKDNIQFFAVPYSKSFPKLKAIRNANNLIEILVNENESLTIEIAPNMRDVLILVVRTLWNKCPLTNIASNDDSYYKLPHLHIRSVNNSLGAEELDGTADSHIEHNSADNSVTKDESVDEIK